MNKQKIICEIEVEHEDKLEFVKIDYPKNGDLYYNEDNNRIEIANQNWTMSKAIILRPIAPPLELETDKFTSAVDRESLSLRVDSDAEIHLDFYIISAAEARDLAALLLYYAETGKLPERVVVRGAR